MLNKKKENLIKLSIFFTWINVLNTYLRVVKICWFYVPRHNTESLILIKLLVVYNTWTFRTLNIRLNLFFILEYAVMRVFKRKFHERALVNTRGVNIISLNSCLQRLHYHRVTQRTGKHEVVE